MKFKKFLSAFVSVAMLASTLPMLMVSADGETVSSTLTYYDESMVESTIENVAYVKGTANISGESTAYDGSKYIIATYSDEKCEKLSAIGMATFASGTASVTDAVSAASCNVVKEFYLNGETLKPIAEATSNTINKKVGTTYKFEAEDYSTATGGFYKTSLYFGTTAAEMSGKDGLNVASGSATYNMSAKSVPAGTYTMTVYGACYSSDTDLVMDVTAGNNTTVTIPASAYTDYTYTDGKGSPSAVATAKVTVTADGSIILKPQASAWIMIDYFTLYTDEYIPTPAPTATPSGTTYKFEAENYDSISEYGYYKTSTYFASTAAIMSGKEGLNVASASATYNMATLGVPAGTYTMTVYGACYSSDTDLVMDVTAGNNTTVAIPASAYDDYTYTNGVGNPSAETAVKVTVTADGSITLKPQNGSAWIMLDYFTLHTDEYIPTPTPSGSPLVTPTPTVSPLGDEWTVNVTWDGNGTILSGEETATLHNQVVQSCAKSNPEWSKYDKTVNLTTSDNSFTFYTWPGQDWSMGTNAFYVDEYYWDLTITKSTSSTKTMDITLFRQMPIPSGTPAPTLTPTAVPTTNPESGVVLVSPANNATDINTHVEGQDTFLSSESYTFRSTATTSQMTEYVNTIKPSTVDLTHSGEIEFTWTSPKESNVFEISENADFSNAFAVTVTGNSYKKNNLKTGTKYYWRVNQSEAYSFTTKKGVRFMTFDENVHNARDIGGYTNLDGQTIRQGLIYRSGQLNKSTNKDCISIDGVNNMVDNLGIKTEIDLRNGYNSPSMYRNVKFVKLGEGILNAYDDFFNQNSDNIKQLFDVISDENNYPLFYHCVAGADRTGVISYLLEAYLGYSEVDMLNDYELTSIDSHSGARARCEPLQFASFQALFNALEGETNREKAKNYFLSCGVTQEQLDAFENIMIIK